MPRPTCIAQRTLGAQWELQHSGAQSIDFTALTSQALGACETADVFTGETHEGLSQH